jgi:imidazolonepropionase-like amidohydrolase
VIDGVAGEPLTGHEIVIENDLIAAVRPIDTGRAVDGQLLELPGTTALAGLIDCHVHYTIDATRPDGIEQGALDAPERAVLIGARNAARALRSGVTTARSAGASRGLDIELAAAIERGDVPGPRLHPAGGAITITGGHGSAFGIQVDGIDGMVAAVRGLVRDGARVIKLVASEAAMLTTNVAGVQELTEVEMTAIVAEVKRLRRTVLAHAQNSSAVVAASRAGVDSVEHAFLADDDALGELKNSGAFLTPTLTVTDVYSTRTGLTDAQQRRQAELSVLHRRSCEAAIRMGIPVLAGTDCGVPGIFADMLPREIALLHDHGLSALDAIRAGTLSAARLLGIDHEVATLVAGKRADILVVDGDPAADLRALAAPRIVLQAGSIVHTESGKR